MSTGQARFRVDLIVDPALSPLCVKLLRRGKKKPPTRGIIRASASLLASGMETPMHEYRCYFLDYRYHVVDQRTIVCETDAAACTFADGLLAAHVYPAIEVWKGQRQIHGARKLPVL